jgi:hypothetical protein
MNGDISEERQADAIDPSTQALDRFHIEEVISGYIKKDWAKVRTDVALPVGDLGPSSPRLPDMYGNASEP